MRGLTYSFVQDFSLAEICENQVIVDVTFKGGETVVVSFDVQRIHDQWIPILSSITLWDFCDSQGTPTDTPRLWEIYSVLIVDGIWALENSKGFTMPQILDGEITC